MLTEGESLQWKLDIDPSPGAASVGAEREVSSSGGDLRNLSVTSCKSCPESAVSGLDAQIWGDLSCLTMSFKGVLGKTNAGQLTVLQRPLVTKQVVNVGEGQQRNVKSEGTVSFCGWVPAGFWNHYGNG